MLAYDSATVRLEVTDTAVASVIADMLPRSGYSVFSLAPVHRSLEDVFMGLVESGDL